MNFPNKEQVIILTISLTNNLLLFDRLYTEQRIDSMNFKLLIKTFHRMKHDNSTIVEEMCSMLAHLVFFMDKCEKVLMHFLQVGVVDVLVYGCEFMRDNN